MRTKLLSFILEKYELRFFFATNVDETQKFLPVGIPSCFDPLPKPLHIIPFKKRGSDFIIAVDF